VSGLLNIAGEFSTVAFNGRSEMLVAPKVSVMTDSDLTRFLSVVDVADILDVDVNDVMNLLKSGELASLRVGDHGPVRIETAQLEAFIAHRYQAEQQLLRMRQAEFSNVSDFTDGRLL
jgi:Helix-turn-helix domain